jgi:hypothetical protein
MVLAADYSGGESTNDERSFVWCNWILLVYLILCVSCDFEWGCPSHARVSVDSDGARDSVEYGVSSQSGRWKSKGLERDAT